METQRELNNIWTIAAKEFGDYIKSKRFILMGILYLVMALALIGITYLNFSYYKDMGMASEFKASEVLGMMDILNIVLVLLAIIITADTISVERKDRTIYQLLSKPVERGSVILGKFIGCLGVVSFFYALSSILAYVLIALLTGVYPGVSDISNAAIVIVFMVVLFAVYVALGILISTVTKNPLISILVGIIAWIALFFSDTIGGLIGSYSQASQSMISLGTSFSDYPIYAKALIWIDPISHDIVRPLLSGATDQNGLPFWANVVILVAFAGILLLLSTELFNRQDI